MLALLPGALVLQDEQVLVRCEPLVEEVRCAAEAVLPVPVDAVLRLVEDPGSYAETYPTIAATEQQPDGTYRVDVRLPWPMPSWPLTVTATSADAGPWKGVHLTDIGGGVGVWHDAEIRVRPDERGSVVQWAWSGPAIYPGWARPRIHRTFGHNAVWALAQAVGAEPEAPRVE